ncbi:50S ribosomal protein L35 [Candidatus Vidania fulgoroideorum]
MAFLKTKKNKSFLKRISKTKNFFKFNKNYKNHILTKKAKKRKRKLRKKIYLNAQSKKWN